MKKPGISYLSTLISAIFLAALIGCVPTQKPTPEETAQQFLDSHSEGAKQKELLEAKKQTEKSQLPVRYQKPSYMLGLSSYSKNLDPGSKKFTLPVGADISTPSGPKPLRSVLNQLTSMKGMNTSWANDVDQNALVDVNIRADEDFFDAVQNILRQLDYFFELHENTLVIKHKETKKFHIAMPFTQSTYSTGVGGDVLGGSGSSNMTGTLSINSSNNEFNIWENVQTNLDKILEIWTGRVEEAAGQSDSTSSGTNDDEGTGISTQETTRETRSQVATAEGTAAATTVTRARVSGRGYYTIDKPIGLITVTAPRSLLEKIEAYLASLTEELYRQISIEAKIIEVTLTNDNTTGIDWNSLLGGGTESTLGLELDFGKISTEPSTPGEGKVLKINPKAFNLVIDALRQQGSVEILSNPRISVMNGQPAMISVGDNVTYVDSVNSTTEDGVVSFTINTASVLSGLGLGVVATILENDDIIMTLTPVTSKLEEPIEYRTFGVNQVGLPKISVRELNTIVRVKDGEMLLVGGLIDNASSYNKEAIPGLGDIPVAGKLFGKDGVVSNKKELIIMLRPKITSL